MSDTTTFEQPDSTAGDFPNVNSLWAAVVAATFARLGGEYAVISPGSRSTPLTIALARHPQIEALPILDERSASFYALGLARRTRKPVLLVCTSGTAAANYYPAVIEAHEAGVPLLILTADRPPEMRFCSSGQTIDQQKIFGDYVQFYKEVALPEASWEMLRYLRQMVAHAYERTLYGESGPVHLNFPFRDPLALEEVEGFSGPSGFELDRFVAEIDQPPASERGLARVRINSFASEMLKTRKGVIVVGTVQAEDAEEFALAISLIAKRLGWPVLADALNPLRNYCELNPLLVTRYDLILRNQELADSLQPDAVLSVGPLPISKVLRGWLQRSRAKNWLLETRVANTDPLHRNAIPLRMSAESLAEVLDGLERPQCDFSGAWLALEKQSGQYLSHALEEVHSCFEGLVPRLLSEKLPAETSLFIANSMPVRDMEYFWRANDGHHEIYVNRGANGIDGTLSTALGLAHGGKKTILLTGDLAFLHDTNGLLAAAQLEGELTVIVVNNDGGGIFEALPVSKFDPPFEAFFATPQQVSLEKLVAAYGIYWSRLEDTAALEAVVKTEGKGLRIFEIETSRKVDMRWRKETFSALAAQLKL